LTDPRYVAPGEKPCRSPRTGEGCGRVLSLDAFTPDDHSPDGRRHVCRECRNAKQRDAYRRNPERVNVQQRERYHADVAASRARVRTSYARHGDKRRTYARGYHDEHRDAIVEKKRDRRRSAS
jgi:hypothetical protein